MVVLHLDKGIPGDVVSDLGTRKAQAPKIETGEVIFSGELHDHDISDLNPHSQASPVIPIRATDLILRLRDFRLPYLGRPEAMAHS